MTELLSEEDARKQLDEERKRIEPLLQELKHADCPKCAQLEADNAALQRQVEGLRRILYLETANWPKANIPRNYELIHDHQRGIVDVKAREGYTIDGATLKGGE